MTISLSGGRLLDALSHGRPYSTRLAMRGVPPLCLPRAMIAARRRPVPIRSSPDSGSQIRTAQTELQDDSTASPSSSSVDSVPRASVAAASAGQVQGSPATPSQIANAALDAEDSATTVSAAVSSSSTTTTATKESAKRRSKRRAQSEPPPPPPDTRVWYKKLPWAKVWALGLLSVSYVHQATTGFSVPAMLPIISSELSLSDFQGAMLTTGYSYLYALALVPVGLLADRVSRPKLLAGGLALWSFLTCTASGAKSFQELLLARVGLAAAQSAQNPICFGLIPELFPRQKSTALALYNCAIYVGRALSFGAVLLARHLNDGPEGDQVAVQMVPMDALDLHSMSIVYTSGDMAAVTPVYDYNFNVIEYGASLPDSSWRQVLRWIAVPGFFIALASLLTLPEPREAKIKDADLPPKIKDADLPLKANTTSTVILLPPNATSIALRSASSLSSITGASSSSLASLSSTTSLTSVSLASITLSSMDGDYGAALSAERLQKKKEKAAVAATLAAAEAADSGGTWGSVLKLLKSPAFLATTFAAAMNDVGSYALIAWQSTFYERVYGLEPSMYAPILAILLPIGGIVGGVGGGALADYLSKRGGRVWITGGASVLAVPFVADSLLAGNYQESFVALLIAFALSEAWRAPSAIMARSTAPASLGSTSSALYLCIRNLVGGLGPISVAALAPTFGLQRAMLLVPAAYLMSGLMFVVAEFMFEREVMQKGVCNI